MKHFARLIGITAFVGMGLVATPAWSAEPVKTPAAVEPSKEPVSATTRGQKEWRAAMARLPIPKQGCYKATYPRVEWQPVSCATAQQLPFPPQHGLRPQNVGNGNDFAGRVPNLITGVVGSFPTVTGVQSETGLVGGAGGPVNDAYSLQINSNFFHNSSCSGNCQAWQQAVFSNATDHGIFIQYWMINPSSACPGGWSTYQGNCYTNSPVTPVPNIPIANLSLIAFSETVNQNQDVVVLSAGPAQYLVNVPSAAQLANGWTDAEFNIFGDCCDASANFNFGSTIQTNVVVHHNSNAAPSCALEGFTGETNNLWLVGSPTLVTQFSPSLIFSQASFAGTPSCATANGIGDTHLETLSGVLYDFQAVGDYILLDDGTGLQVQARQGFGPPAYPNTSVNTGFATRMANTTVSLCIAPDNLEVNQQPATLQNGQTITTPDGVQIRRNGNFYYVRDQRGNSVLAQVNPTWIDVYIDLGHTPSVVTRGLLVNPGGNVNQLQGRDGTIYPEPISFDNLYNHFGESWRLSAKEDLLCKIDTHPHSNPTRSFYARDLTPDVYARARSVCTKAGVKGTALLNACTLDVAVLGRHDAAKAFAAEQPPVAVFQAHSH